MPSPTRWTRFRFRLAAAIVAATLVPILSIAAVALTAARGHLEAAAVRLNAVVLDGLASNLALFAAQRTLDLQSLALDPRIQALDPGRAETALRAFLVDESFFVRVELLDAAGTRVAGGAGPVASPAAPVPPESLARAAAEVVRTGRAIAGAHGSGPDQPRTWLVPVRALADPGQVRGVLVGSAVLDGTEIQALLDTSGAGDDGFVCIVDPQGEVLARRGPGLSPRVRALAPAGRFAKPGVPGPEGPPLVLGEGADRALVSMVWSPPLAVWIVRGEPWARAFALVGTLGESLAAALAIALVGALGAAAWISHRIGAPITALAAAIGSLRDGVLTVRLEPTGDDEIGAAAEAVNNLAVELQKRTLVGATWEELRKGPVPPL